MHHVASSKPGGAFPPGPRSPLLLLPPLFSLSLLEEVLPLSSSSPSKELRGVGRDCKYSEGKSLASPMGVRDHARYK